MEVIIGSARINERGGISGGAAGDQKQTNTPDMKGEVSCEKFYIHKLGWIILRAKSTQVARKLAVAMLTACNNKNIGYDQGTYRLGVVKYGTNSGTLTGCDCSSLIRQCVREAAGVDAGNFNTGTEKNALLRTGLFNEVKFTKAEDLREGDILVTLSRGHTAIVLNALITSSGVNVSDAESAYYRVYAGKWLPEVKDLEDYAGIENKPISGVMVRVPKHKVETRVRIKNSTYLPWVSGYDEKDNDEGYAGIIGKEIDGLQLKIDSKRILYRVSVVGSKAYLPWVDGTKDYAGLKGKSIDKIQVYVK